MTRWQDRHKLVPAVYIIVEQGGKVLLLRRFNTGYQDGNYTMPSGHLEGDEAPSVAAARELYEEVGLTVDAQQLDLIHAMVYKAQEGDHERVSLFFKAPSFTGEPSNMESDKCDDVCWFPADELPTNVVWEVQHALNRIKAGKHYSELNY